MAAHQPQQLVIRTTDRITYKRCRRKWDFGSHLRRNLTGRVGPVYFWSGTGLHFALEDFHGFRNYGTPRQAFDAYVAATRQLRGTDRMPEGWLDEASLFQTMLDYYLEWLQDRDELQTLWIGDQPQVEVRVQVPLPLEAPPGYDEVVYGLTFDRVAVDDLNRIWVVEYKSYKSFDSGKLDFDPQVSAYLWGAGALYGPLGYEIGGVMYQQHLKAEPKPPMFLQSGKFSTSKQQRTSRKLYKQALLKLYGTNERIPTANREFLNHLATLENEDLDPFIRRDRVERNATHRHNTGRNILLEAAEMLDPDLLIYPNHTKDCSWDCREFSPACLMIESGDDWEYELKQNCISREEEDDSWRQYLPTPQPPQPVQALANV